MLTFSGCQSIKLTVNNMKPTDLMMLDPNSGIKDQQRAFLEVNAQFGAIKSLLCPKQIHLLTEMATKLTDYIEAASVCKKAIRLAQQKQRYLKRAGKSKKTLSKHIRGCDNKRKFESLIHNDLMFNQGVIDGIKLLDDEEIDLNDDENENYKSILITDQQQQHMHHRAGTIDESAMFYSMMSESTLLNKTSSVLGGNSGPTLDVLNESMENLANDSEKFVDDEDRNQVKFTKR